MTKKSRQLSAQLSRPPVHRAEITLRAGRRVGIRLSGTITSHGLLAIGGLVSMILLSTAALIAVAQQRRVR